MRATRATRAMVALLRGHSAERFTAAETTAALARKGVAVNRVTVFRALDRLTQAGLLQRRVDADRLTRYQWGGDAGPAAAPRSARWPASFYCDRCQTETPVDAALPAVQPALAQLVAALAPLGEGQSVQVHGMCAQCPEL